MHMPSVPKCGVPKTLVFAFGLRMLRSKRGVLKRGVLKRGVLKRGVLKRGVLKQSGHAAFLGVRSLMESPSRGCDLGTSVVKR